uniref:Uncharacterized protein n=1 Tax=Romanomermis culicivorax TaxID=13658 RepID=A0A915INQ8_ROMCU
MYRPYSRAPLSYSRSRRNVHLVKIDCYPPNGEFRFHTFLMICINGKYLNLQFLQVVSSRLNVIYDKFFH